MPKVSGSSIATPEGGPMPGSAPISMPTMTPTTAINTLNGVKATEKPSERLPRKSTAASEPERPDRERHVQPVGEDEPVEAGRARRHREHQQPGMAAEVAHQHREEQRRCRGSCRAA